MHFLGLLLRHLAVALVGMVGQNVRLGANYTQLTEYQSLLILGSRYSGNCRVTRKSSCLTSLNHLLPLSNHMRSRDLISLKRLGNYLKHKKLFY